MHLSIHTSIQVSVYVCMSVCLGRHVRIDMYAYSLPDILQIRSFTPRIARDTLSWPCLFLAACPGMQVRRHQSAAELPVGDRGTALSKRTGG